MVMLAMGSGLHGLILGHDCSAINAIIMLIDQGGLPMHPVSLLLASAVLGLSSMALAQPVAPPPDNKADVTLRSTPDTVVWGYFAADIPPALRIKSGQTVRIDTVSHAGLNTRDDPVRFFGKAGIPADQVLKDGIEIYQKVNRPRGASAHVLTGPLYVDEAAPGDMLEVRILALEPRVPYGVNNSNRGTGVLPDLLTAPTPKVIRFDTARNVALFSPDIEVPLKPFMGIMAVAPSREAWMISSRPPWHWGGNMDFNKLTVGATLYLPVFHKGAQFFTGDSHAVQGDGEINGTAIEASLTGTFQFIVHKGAGRTMRWPRAEDATHYYAMGMDLDLDIAMKNAAQETVDFLRATRGLSEADAYALASIAVDFRVAEAVDAVQMVYGAIPKSIFKSNPDYWARK
jgi:acetamidase/formamidase